MTLEATLVHAPFAPPVHGFCTTRSGGASPPPFESLNLGAVCGDNPACVDNNRRRLQSLLPSSAKPHWLTQVHGKRVIHLDNWCGGVEADAAWTDRSGQVAAVLTADCLPLLIAERDGKCAGAVHAGWRGLAAGIIAEYVAAMPSAPTRLVAWIGPRICRDHYEIDAQVRNAFPGFGSAFAATREGHWLADLPLIARRQLAGAGVSEIIDSGVCTAGSGNFFSYRRDGVTGRMATVVWIDGED